MGETADNLKQHIDYARSRISQDLNELDYRVHRAADWRLQFRKHSRAILASAFALGFLIGMVSGGAGRENCR